MKKKMMNLALVMVMVLSVLPAASAVSAEPLSQYAGQTITVRAVEEAESGLTSRVVEVTIPEGATETEARTLIHATAFGWDMVSAHSGDFTVTDLGSKTNFTLGTSETTIVNRTLSSELNEIYLTFSLGTQTPNSGIQAKLKNGTTGTSSSWKTATFSPDPAGRDIREVVFKTTAIRMNSGDQITAYAKSTNGNIYINSCYVTGYYRY